MADFAGVAADAFVDALHEWEARNFPLEVALKTDEAAEQAAADLGRRAAAAVLAPLEWERALGERYDTREVGLLLGVTRQAIRSRLTAGSLLGLPGRGTTWFPAWQFEPERREVRPLVARVLAVFADAAPGTDPLTVAAWAVTAQPELDGETPEAWVTAGRADGPVLRAARAAGAGLAA